MASLRFAREISSCALLFTFGCIGDAVPADPTHAVAHTTQTLPVAVDSVHESAVTEVLTATTASAALSRAAATTAASPPFDSTSVATDAEIAALHAVLGMPVSGVKPADLRDTYAEARTGHTHEALDIPAPRGTPVLSAAPGVLLKIFESKAGGHMVYAADESDRFILLYAHLDRYADGLKEGMPLVRGQLLGYVGTSGNAPPEVPHLHFGILRGLPSHKWWAGVPINPFPILVK